MSVTSDTTQMIIDECTRRGYFVWRQNNLAVRGRKFKGMKGVPDIIGGDAGQPAKWFSVEVKTDKDKQSKAQKDFQFQIEKRGGRYLIAKTFTDFMQQMGWRK